MTFDISRLAAAAQGAAPVQRAEGATGGARVPRSDQAAKGPEKVPPVAVDLDPVPNAIDHEALVRAVEETNQTLDALANSNRTLRFDVDDSTGQVVVKVVDRNSLEVLRQVPSEELLEVSTRVSELRALLFDQLG